MPNWETMRKYVKWLKVAVPVAIAIALLVALVVAKNAHAAALDDVSRQQAETSKIKSQLQTSENDKKALEQKLNAETEKNSELEKENADLKAKRQAKLEAARQATRNAQIRVVAVSGTCSEWLAQAGVSDVANATWLINKESGCNPNAVNRSSGACGIAQELPCGKSGCSLGDGACQIRWMQQYVNARYGSWAGAVAFHQAHGWY